MSGATDIPHQAVDQTSSADPSFPGNNNLDNFHVIPFSDVPKENAWAMEDLWSMQLLNYVD